MSRLTIKSAIIEDSGNYTCVLPTTNYSDTVRLVVVSGKSSQSPPYLVGTQTATPPLITTFTLILCLEHWRDALLAFVKPSGYRAVL